MTIEGVALIALVGLVVGCVGAMLVAFAATYRHPWREAGPDTRRQYVVPAFVFVFIAIVSAVVLIVAGIVATVRAIT